MIALIPCTGFPSILVYTYNVCIDNLGVTFRSPYDAVAARTDRRVERLEAKDPAGRLLETGEIHPVEIRADFLAGHANARENRGVADRE